MPVSLEIGGSMTVRRDSYIMVVASYQDFYLLEDDYLRLHMLMVGDQSYNQQKQLFLVRAGVGMYKRCCFAIAELDKKTFVYMVVEKIEKGKYRSDQDSLCHQLHRKEWT